MAVRGPLAFRKSARIGAGLVLAALALAVPRSAQAPDAVVPGADEETSGDRLWFAFEERIPLADLVWICVRELDLPLEFEPGRIDGEVTIRSGPGLSTDELWALTNRHLAARGLACVQAPEESVLSVVTLDEAPNRARLEPGDLAEAPAGYVRALRTLRHAEPAAVAETIQNVLGSAGSFVTAIPSTSQVLMAGLKPQVIEALTVLDALDAGKSGIVIETFTPGHLAPEPLASLVDRVRKAQEKAGESAPAGSLLANVSDQSVVIVAPEDEVAAWTGLLRQFDRAEAVVTGHYSPRRFGLAETARLIEEAVFSRRRPDGVRGGHVVRDELTGTLIVEATWSQHEAIDGLLERLEATPPESRRALRSFPVRNRDVEELLTLLTDLLEDGSLLGETLEEPPTETGTGGKAIGAAPVEAPAPSRALTTELGVTLTQDAGTNRIVAVGPPRLLDEVGELIAQLDERSPQVLVEALIVNVTDAQTRDLGVELQKGLRSGDTLFRLQSLFGLGSPDPGLSAIPASMGSGFTSVVLDPGSFSGVIRALETVNRGRTLTMPKVLVGNNESADLNSILQTPFTTTSLSTSTTVTTFGGTLDAGTTIQVTPQITEGDMLLLDYSVALSTFVGESADPAIPPPRQETSLASVASVPDGYAIVIGGLEIETESEAESRTPWLGSLPLFGALFRNESDSTSRSRFFVFLRCSVMRDSSFGDLRFASRRDLDVAGVGTGAPEVRPLVMR